jgi:hypothetical protein
MRASTVVNCRSTTTCEALRHHATECCDATMGCGNSDVISAAFTHSSGPMPLGRINLVFAPA